MKIIVIGQGKTLEKYDVHQRGPSFQMCPSRRPFSSGFLFFPQEQGGASADLTGMRITWDSALYLHTGYSHYMSDMQLDAGANCFFVAVLLLKGV